MYKYFPLHVYLSCFIFGTLGSYVETYTGLFWSFFRDFFCGFNAMALGICIALLIAESMIDSSYSLSINICFNSPSLRSLFLESEQILTILSANENGIFFIQSGGWQLEGNRY